MFCAVCLVRHQSVVPTAQLIGVGMALGLLTLSERPGKVRRFGELGLRPAETMVPGVDSCEWGVFSKASRGTELECGEVVHLPTKVLY